MQGISEAQAAMLWADYADDLAGWSLDLIDEACRRWRRSEEKFFPTSGQLLAILRKIAAERAPKPRALPPPEYRRDPKVGALLTDFLAKWKEKGAA